MSIVLHSVNKRHRQLKNSKTLTPRKLSQSWTTSGQGMRCGFSIRHCHGHWIMAAWLVFLHFFLVSERQMLLIFGERFSWSGQTSLWNGFSGYNFHESTIESNFLFYYSPMSMLFRNKNNKILSKTRRKISSMSSITKLKDSTWCACFITRWRVFYRCVQLVQAQATQT